MRPSLWSRGQSAWLQTQRSKIQFLALPHFLRNIGSAWDIWDIKEIVGCGDVDWIYPDEDMHEWRTQVLGSNGNILKFDSKGYSEEAEFGQFLMQLFPNSLVVLSAVQNIKILMYKTIILHLALYGCNTLSPTISEEHSLRLFENKMLNRITGPKRDEVIGGWRKPSA
jgi:hypothetical protein